MRAVLGVMGAVNIGTFIFDLIAAPVIAALPAFVVVFLVLLMLWQTRIIRRVTIQARPHPDYARIAELERELGWREPDPPAYSHNRKTCRICRERYGPIPLYSDDSRTPRGYV
jgi:hypothetical protein